LAALGFIAYQGEDGGWSNGDDTKAGAHHGAMVFFVWFHDVRRL
jgi:hypothetical protein